MAVVAPSRASALVYPGEALVETIPGGGAGDTLTGPAKAIITNPTFLAAEPAEAAVLGESAAMTDALVGAGALPALSAVLPWVAGAAIGTAVACEVFIGGCFEFFGGTDATKTPSVSWTRKKEGCSSCGSAGAPVPVGGYYTSSPEAFAEDVEEVCGAGSSGLPHFPKESTFHYRGGSGTISCPPSKTYVKSTGVRTGNEGRNFKPVTGKTATYTGSDYCPVGGTCASKPSTSWPENFVRCLHGNAARCGLSEAEAAHIGQAIAHEVDPSVHSPFKTYVSIPSCDEITWGACKALLEGKELEPIREDLDWSEVTTTVPDQVQELNPAESTEVEVPSKVKVITNPDEDGMPVVVPSPEHGETYTHYAARLNPALSPHRVNVGESYTDTEVGPGAVLRVTPSGGTKLDPATSTEVEIQTNPDTAPDAGPGTSAWSAPAIPALDLSPLQDVHIGCNSFPFGVFCWMADGLTSWGSEGSCPSFDVPFTSEIRDSTADLEFDTCTFEPAMNIIRPMVVILSFFGVAWLLSASAMGLGGGASADD